VSTYREIAAANTVKACHELGAVLLATGSGIHAYPVSALKRRPGIVFMIRRYRPEIMRLLDDTVE
jgi:hypothetical protein